MSRMLRILSYAMLLGAFIMSVSSCDKDDDPASTTLGTISGTVTDDTGAPLSGVTVTVSGVNEADQTATTGGDGKYTVDGVTVKLHSVTFSKTDYLTISKSVEASSFGDTKVAAVDAKMASASAKITGVVTDAKNGNAPLAGVKVTVGAAGTTTTAADGSYTLSNLVVGNYTVEFSKDTYVTVSKNVTAASFTSGIATLNVAIGSQEVLRGLTAEQLSSADKWYYNEYRGGRNADAYPHWDWACNYMSSLTFWGAWQEQNEGTTLQIRNNEDQRGNPADLNVFDSYTYGSKRITAENKILSVRMRTHNADANAPAYWGVQVVDLSSAEPTAVKIGENKTYGSGDYADFEFDLSDYVGKEVIIAVGIYRQATGDYYKQLVLRAVRFADKKVSNWDWLPGTQVVAGWKLTRETAASTMPHTKYSFSGISRVSGNRDDYVNAYRSWRENSHVGAEWSFVPLKKDPEVFAGEGFLIKTRNTTDVSLSVPEAYLYAKFSITPDHDALTFTTRNFGSNYTYFKITAIENDGTVTHVEPTTNTAQEALAATEGAWKFKHGNGDAGNPEAYAAFVYDLSAFDGKEVTIVIGVYNGEPNSGENKLVFHTINLN